MRKYFIIALLVFFPTPLLLADGAEINFIQIRTYDRCLQSVVYENLDLSIYHLGSHKEDHHLDIRCNFNNDLDFKTESGYTCNVRSGACSGFLPAQEVIVECSRDGHKKRSVAEIACP